MNAADDSLPTISDADDGAAGLVPEVPPQIEGYEIIGFLGRGGMGAVWRARQLSIKRQVAVKVLASRRLRSERARAFFEREVELAARMEHPNIARVYESGFSRDARYYALELVDGVPLHTYIEQHNLGRRQVLELMRTICRAVQYAHQRGIIHQDLKPSNILVSQDGQPHILDFGLAKTFVPDDEHAEAALEGEIAGTPAFMSPEQAAGRQDVIDTRTDVYSLGVMLFHFVTHRWPRDLAGSRQEVLHCIAHEEAATPRSVCPGIDRDLDAVLLKALARDPEHRYSSAGDLAGDLGSYLLGNPVTARQHSVTWHLMVRFWKHRVTAALAFGLLAVLSVVAVVYHVQVDRYWRMAEAGLYNTRIALAEAELRAGNVTRVRELLDVCPEERRGWEWYHLRHMHDQSCATFSCDEVPLAMAVSPTGPCLATAGYESNLTFRDARTGEVRLRCAGRAGPIAALAFSPDGRRVVSGGADQVLRLWDVGTGKELKAVQGHSGLIHAVAFSPDGRYVASGGMDRLVKIWNAADLAPVKVLEGHEGEIGSVAFCPSGRQIASGSWDGTVRVWDALAGTVTWKLTGHPDEVYVVAFSPDGKWILSAGRDGAPRMWNADTGERAAEFRGYSEAIYAAAFSPDGQTIVSGGADGSLQAWDVAKSELCGLLRGHTGAVRTVAFLDDGRHVLSAGEGKTLRLWDLSRSADCLKGHDLAVTCVAVHPDGRHMVSASDDRTLVLWDLDTGHRTPLGGLPIDFKSLAFNSDGKSLRGVAANGAVFQCDGAGGPWLPPVGGGRGTLLAAALSPDSRFAAFSGGDRSISVRFTETGDECLCIGPGTQDVSCLAFSPDDRRIAAACNGTILIWSTKSGREVCRTAELDDRILALAFSEDGRHILSGHDSGAVRLWNAETGALLAVLAGHSGPVIAVAFSIDGRRLVSGGNDKTIKVWDAAMGTELLTLRGHRDGVTCVAFSRDGRLLISGSRDKTIRLWDSGPRKSGGGTP